MSKPKISFNDFVKQLKESKTEDKRQVNTSKQRQYFLIVCEGERTEPNYFNSFRKRLPNHMLETIEIVGAGANTITVVKEAIALRDQRKALLTMPEYDQVWAVFDRDSFPAKNVNKAHLLAENEDVKCAFSNEAFELWYLLHFEYLNVGISRNQYTSKLTAILSRILKRPAKYEKNDKEIYEILEKHGNQKQAIKFAKKLEKETEQLTATDSKPSTTVFLLVETLNEYLK